MPGPGAARQEDLAGGLQADVGCPVSSALEISAGVTSPRTPPPKVAEEHKGPLFPAWPPAYSISLVCLFGNRSKGQRLSEASGEGAGRLVNGTPGI